MNAFCVDTLVVPAARAVDGTRRVDFLSTFREPRAVELTPALVERHPHTYRNAVIKIVEHLEILRSKFVAGLLVFSCEESVTAVGYHKAQKRQHGYAEEIVFSAARNHILPDYHSESVAMIIPAHRLDFYMLAKHVEAEVFHKFDIVNHSLVRRGSKHTIAPVSLVEQTVVEIGLIVEEQPHFALRVLSVGELAHSEVTSYHIAVAHRDDVVRMRVLWRP